MNDFLFMAMPPPVVRDAILRALALLALDARKLFPPDNWHQSLSEKHAGDAGLRERLLRAGERVCANAFPVTFDRIHGKGSHWALVAKSPPAEFPSLLAAVRTSLHGEGIADTAGHTAHITLDYFPRTKLATARIESIHWMVDEFMLVEAETDPYRYDMVDRWRLRPCPNPPPVQMTFL